MRRSLLADFAHSVKHPDFWAYSSWLEVVTKYRRSKLGLAWMFIPVFAFIVVLGYFYAGLIHVPAREFIAYLGVGYAVWRLIIQVINDSASTLFHHQSFIMDGRVRLTDYFLRVLSKSLFYFAPAMLVVVATLFWSGHVGFGVVGGLLLGLPVLLLNLAWVTVVISLIGARFPDTHELVTTVLIFGFLLTPILWYPTSVAPGSLRALFIDANPAFHLIEAVRAPIMGTPISRTTMVYLPVMTVVGWSVASWLYRRYSRYVPLWF